MTKVEPSELHQATIVAVERTKLNWFLTVRFRIALLLCFGSAAINIMHSNFYFAIICMLNVTAIEAQTIEGANDSAHNDTEIEQGCQNLLTTNSQILGSIVWTPRIQGLVLASSVWGVMLTIFTGWLADKLNSKLVIGLSILLASVASLLTPIASMYESVAFILIIRVTIGLCDSLVQPSVNCIITRWFPPSERNTVFSIATGGRQLGTLLILPLSGQLCTQTTFANGWPSIFYISGMIGIVWVVIWFAFAADKPAQHPRISAIEQTKLRLAMQGEQTNVKRRNKVVPWCQILSSSVCWATIVSVVCHEFPMKTFTTFIPNYYRDVLYFSLRTNGVFSALPLVCYFFCKLAASAIADRLQICFQLNKTAIAKVANSLASFGLGAFLIGVSFLDCHSPALAVLFLCLSMAFGGVHTPGCKGTLLRIAPAYAGTITGIAYELTAASSLINAAVTKEIVKVGTRQEWSIVFYISATVALVPLIMFNIWGSAEVQTWAISPPKQNTNDANEDDVSDKKNAKPVNCKVDNETKI